MDQLDLFSQREKKDHPSKLGHSEIDYDKSGSILTKTSGFMETYDFSLNPYSGCSFGCTYCYAAFFARSKEKQENWGYWVKVKENAVDLLKKFRKKPLQDKTIYISSVTDPYQPIERKLALTRDILRELADFHNPRIVIQTRSQLVTRDIDILKQFKVIQVNMTITTDSEEVRKVFEPYCPSNKIRLKAIKEVNDAGIQTCITMTPLLPINDANSFADDLVKSGIGRFIIQPFHSEKGKFVAGTREEAFKIIKKFGWDIHKYREALTIIKSKIPQIGEGKEGFAPV